MTELIIPVLIGTLICAPIAYVLTGVGTTKLLGSFVVVAFAWVMIFLGGALSQSAQNDWFLAGILFLFLIVSGATYLPAMVVRFVIFRPGKTMWGGLRLAMLIVVLTVACLLVLFQILGGV